jgi:hypothetical protein
LWVTATLPVDEFLFRVRISDYQNEGPRTRVSERPLLVAAGETRRVLLEPEAESPEEPPGEDD